MQAVIRRARPRRGTPQATRERLVEAAARVFNRDGYHATDSNRLARAAGYAPGTFYKHFADKREIFLAVYDAWVTAEWAGIETELSRSTGGGVAARIVDGVLAHHRRWRTLRVSLLGLVGTDTAVRRAYRRQRVRQLEMLADLRKRHGVARHSPEDDAVLLFTLERTCDALAAGEVRELGLSVERTIAVLRRLVRDALRDPSDEGTA